MPTEPKKSVNNTTTLEFKSSTFSVPVLVLSTNDLEQIEGQLKNKIQLSPEFFKNTPVVFDLQLLNSLNLAIDIKQLTEILRYLHLLPIGIHGGNKEQIQDALDLHIPIYSNHTNVSASSRKAKPDTTSVSEKRAENPTTIIKHPVRSGQRIYAHGDLIITAQVSAGAEIMAEGNIHIYNTLRGRALAGVQGDSNACIFCFDLQAELISIAGHYKISEDLSETVRNKPIQIYLEENSLIIKDII